MDQPINTPKAQGSCTKCKILDAVEHQNTNRHNPVFRVGHKGSITCRINEVTGRVKLDPRVKVSDKDSGNDGKIMGVIVRESEMPFRAIYRESTGRVDIQAEQEYKFSAKRKATYKFSLIASDKGTKPRTSKPLHITCKVVPKKKNNIAVNNYAPVFDTFNYVGRVKQGTTSDNIVKVSSCSNNNM